MIVTPPSHLHTSVCLFCCLVFVVLLKFYPLTMPMPKTLYGKGGTQRWKMVLVVQFDLSILQCHAPLPTVLRSAISGFVSGGSQLAFREEQRGEPLFSRSLKENLYLVYIKYGAHKEMGDGIRGIIAAKGQVQHRLSDPLLRQIPLFQVILPHWLQLIFVWNF